MTVRKSFRGDHHSDTRLESRVTIAVPERKPPSRNFSSVEAGTPDGNHERHHPKRISPSEREAVETLKADLVDELSARFSIGQPNLAIAGK